MFLALLGLNLSNAEFYTASTRDALYYFGVPFGLAVASVAALRLPFPWRLSVALCCLAAVPALYAAELYITFAQESRLEEAAEARGVEVDERRKIDVIADLRRGGVSAYPAVRAKDLLVKDANGVFVSPIRIRGQESLPLAGVPDSIVVACNEAGRWLIYRSDRHGFRNPPEAWQGPVDLALVGDSFVHGDCVDSDDTIAGRLRRHTRVLNLGVAGFGPLSMLAAIKEYLPALKPRTVVWFFFEGNDIADDLARERRSALLMAYLRPGFRQGLPERRDEMAQALAAYLDRHMAEAMARIDHPYEDVLNHIKLYRLREVLGLDPIGLGAVSTVTDEAFQLFRAVLAEARRTVDAWGGRLMFAYLADSARYFGGTWNGRIRDRIRDQVLAIAAELRLPVIDVHRAFVAQPDPKALFYYAGSHYNAAGYRVVATAVEKALGLGTH